jgi:hypothetical protein
MLLQGREISEDSKMFNFGEIFLSHGDDTKNQVFSVLTPFILVNEGTTVRD